MSIHDLPLIDGRTVRDDGSGVDLITHIVMNDEFGQRSLFELETPLRGRFRSFKSVVVTNPEGTSIGGGPDPDAPGDGATITGGGNLGGANTKPKTRPEPRK